MEVYLFIDEIIRYYYLVVIFALLHLRFVHNHNTTSVVGVSNFGTERKIRKIDSQRENVHGCCV